MTTAVANGGHRDTDVIVVGSGVAGGLVAAELARAGARVTVLEAGDRVDRKEAVTRFRGSWRQDLASPFVTPAHAPVPDGETPDGYLEQLGPVPYRALYVRAVGGTTWHWTGMTPRFLPQDFELRSRYRVGRDWPFGYGVLEPYYARAEVELGVSGDSDDDHGSPRSTRYPMAALPMPYGDQVCLRRLAPHGIAVKVMPAARNSAPYAGRPACCGSGSCSPICPVGASYSADVHAARAEKAGAQLITGAVAHALDASADGSIQAVRWKDAGGREHRVAGRIVVLACNGIETPRLMLMSRSERTPQGIGNATHQVGRYLMDHPTLTMSYRTPEPMYRGRGPQIVSTINTHRDGPFRAQRAAVKYVLSNALDPVGASVEILESQRDWSGIRHALRGAATFGGEIVAEFEQLPDRDNRVMLSASRRDPLGLPVPAIRYAYDAYTREGLRASSAFLKRMIVLMGGQITEGRSIGDQGSQHLMGTTLMGMDPRDSVVDANCRVHQHSNLYIAGSSVFPSSGTANPTLTIAALSLRLADRLKTVLAQRGVR